MQKNQTDQFLPKYLFLSQKANEPRKGFFRWRIFRNRNFGCLVCIFSFSYWTGAPDIYFSKFAFTIYKGLVEENYCNDFLNVTFLLHQQVEQNSVYFFLFGIFLFFLHLVWHRAKEPFCRPFVEEKKFCLVFQKRTCTTLKCNRQFCCVKSDFFTIKKSHKIRPYLLCQTQFWVYERSDKCSRIQWPFQKVQIWWHLLQHLILCSCWKHSVGIEIEGSICIFCQHGFPWLNSPQFQEIEGTYMQKTCDVAEKAILAKKNWRKKCANRDKM